MGWATGNVAAKTRAFYGRLVTPAGNGVAGYVASKDRKYVFPTRPDGVFSFRANEDSIDYMVFAAPNYDPKEFLVEDLPEDSIIIELPKHKMVLDEALVKGNGKAVKTAYSGINSGHPATGCYLNIYDELAIYLPAEKGKHGMMGEIGIYIMKEGVITNDFQLHVYNRDSASGGPGEEITDSALVVHARKGGEWVTADLTQKYIPVHEGIFLTVEWLVGTRNDYYPRAIPPTSPNYYAGDD
ncbi:MAG: hypothetical protein EBZ77_17680, partial [Chitinophagia bacterium]|nr:hypothetical protein [Chitinophagia bacterium]